MFWEAGLDAELPHHNSRHRRHSCNSRLLTERVAETIHASPLPGFALRRTSKDYFNLIAGSPRRIHVRRTSRPGIAAFAPAVTSPSVSFPPALNNNRYASWFITVC